MYRLFIFLSYPAYSRFTCLIFYDWCSSYGDVAIWDKLLTIVSRVMTTLEGNYGNGIRSVCTQFFDLNEQSDEINFQSFNERKEC